MNGIIRIVRMEFRPEGIDRFQEIFHESKLLIRQFPGCDHLELHRDAHQPTVFYTYSHWESLEALEAYRKSKVFRGVWPETKSLFAASPQTFSLKRLDAV
jgi:quinol monooxygenase YgiN